ncbi:MAG TPA: hypothetical protein VE988_03300 [Gemmataceae bacterium]|nr:hypothetical protein [Gemmataceae bacterium]
MLFAATPVPDAEWLPPALVLIFAVPIGAFLSLYAILTSFLFHTFREGMPVYVLNVLAFGLNGCAFLYLVDTPYNAGRYLVVPLMAWAVALGAGAVTSTRAVGMWQAEHRVKIPSQPSPSHEDRTVWADEEFSSLVEDR